MGTSWEIDPSEEPTVLPCTTDLGLDPDHRSAGLFEELSTTAVEHCAAHGYSHVINLSASPENHVSSIVRLGWRRASGYEVLRRAPDAANPSQGPPPLWRRIRSARTKLRKALRGGYAAPFRQLDAARPEPRTPITVHGEPPTSDMVDLVARIGPSGRLRHVRDPEYVNWRYRNPLSTYRFLTWGTSPIDGYLVLRAPRDGPRVRIVDLEAVDAEVSCRLVDHALDGGRFATVDTWGVSWPADVVAYLRQRGFSPPGRPAPRHVGVIIRPTGEVTDDAAWGLKGRSLLDPSSWDLRMIYSDAS